jgi:hypothetical protein
MRRPLSRVLFRRQQCKKRESKTDDLFKSRVFIHGAKMKRHKLGNAKSHKSGTIKNTVRLLFVTVVSDGVE